MLKEKLKDLRVSNKYTQDKLASILNISRPTYTRYETGERNPDYETLIALANIYKVSTDYLLGVTTTNKPIDTSIIDCLNEELAEKEKYFLNLSKEEKLKETLEKFNLEIVTDDLSILNENELNSLLYVLKKISTYKDYLKIKEEIDKYDFIDITKNAK